MKRIKQIKKYRLDHENNKIYAGLVDYYYDEQQCKRRIIDYDYVNPRRPKVSNYFFDKKGHNVARKFYTMSANGFSSEWRIDTYDEEDKIVRSEGCISDDDRKIELLYLYNPSGDLSEIVSTIEGVAEHTKYLRKGNLYESVGKSNEKYIFNKNVEEIFSELRDDDGNVLRSRIREFDDYGRLTVERITPAPKETDGSRGHCSTKTYERDQYGNAVKIITEVSWDLGSGTTTEIREIEYYDEDEFADYPYTEDQLRRIKKDMFQ